MKKHITRHCGLIQIGCTVKEVGEKAKIGKDRINSKVSPIFLCMFCLLISKMEQFHVVTGMSMVCLQQLALTGA